MTLYQRLFLDRINQTKQIIDDVIRRQTKKP